MELKGTRNLAGKDDESLLRKFSTRIEAIAPMVVAKGKRDRHRQRGGGGGDSEEEGQEEEEEGSQQPYGNWGNVKNLRRRAKETERRARHLGVPLPDGEPGAIARPETVTDLMWKP